VSVPSTALVTLNLDALVIDQRAETTVDVDGHRAADLDELALADDQDAEAA
jgi:hypothetical protein